MMFIHIINRKRQERLNVEARINDENRTYERELTKLNKNHNKKIELLSKKKAELDIFFNNLENATMLETQKTNSSPCGDELAYKDESL